MAIPLRSVLLVSHAAVNVCVLRRLLLETLRERGVATTVALPHAEADVAAGELHALDIPVLGYPLRRGSLNPLNLARGARGLSRVAAQTRPQIVHSFTHQPNIVSRLADTNPAVLVNSVTGLGSLFLWRGAKGAAARAALRTLYRLTAPRAQAVIFQNPDDKTYFMDAAMTRERRAHIIPGTGVDLERFHPRALPPAEREELRAEFGFAPDHVVFVMAARLVAEKGVREFLQAGERLRTAHPRARLLLVGEPDPGNPGSLGPAEIDSWRGMGFCEFAGWRTDMARIWAAGDVAVLPSYYGEGLPVTLQEGLASGLPVVTTTVPGCREIGACSLDGLPAPHAVIIPPRDVGSLAEAMDQLLDDDVRRNMALAARKVAETHFDGRALAREVLALYERLLQH